MDTGKVFVLILTFLSVGILVYLELKSRRARRESQEVESDSQAGARKTVGKY
jgi:hypothetical protein